MKQPNKHSNLDDFKRYRANKMSEAERNAFERELQKNPFEAEAFEGLQLLSDAEIDHDIAQLDKQIRTKKSHSILAYWAAAASILLLLLTGILLHELKNKAVIPEVAQKSQQPHEKAASPIAEKPAAIDSVQPKNEEDAPVKLAENSKQKTKAAQNNQAKPATMPTPPNEEALMKESTTDLAPISPQAVYTKAEEQPVNLQVEEALQGQLPGIRIRGTRSIRRSAAKQAFESQMAPGLVQGRVFDKEGGFAMPGVLVVEKGSSNGTLTDENGMFTLQLTNAKDSLLIACFVGMESLEFKANPDSFIVAQLQPNKLALDEVVVIGYGIRKKNEVTGSVSRVSIQEKSNYEQAQPLGGMQALKDYLVDKTGLPGDFPDSKVVVRIKVSIAKNGQLLDFGNANSADDKLFAKACELLRAGPKWQAARRNGTTLDSTVVLRIVFRK